METGDPNRTVKNSLNYVSTCLRVVDTRRSDKDCAVVVFREITGEDEETASTHFSLHLQEDGTPVQALSSCLADAGWMLAQQKINTEGVFNRVRAGNAHEAPFFRPLNNQPPSTLRHLPLAP
jgi:hypothetical protein